MSDGQGHFGHAHIAPTSMYYKVFGALIIGTILTVNHGHAAFIGVFGMLGVGLMAYVLREVTSDSVWPRIEKFLGIGFWGLNIGLAMMIVFSLFPGGLLQVWDVLQNGYWHARSPEYLSGQLPRLIEWLRMPGDLVFIFVGVLPIVLALLVSYREMWRGQIIEPELKLAR